MNQVGAMLFETLLFLYVKRTADTVHIHFCAFQAKKEKKRETAGELQGLRVNAMNAMQRFFPGITLTH